MKVWRLPGAIAILIIAATAGHMAMAQTVGLFVNDPRAWTGYTLFAPKHYGSTYLINNDGKLLHSWSGSKYEPGQSVYLLENGNLLRSCMVKGPLSAGGGEGGRIEEYDWNGSLVWQFDYNTATYSQHHDIKPLPNGNILMLVVEKKTMSEAIAAGFNPSQLQSVQSTGYMLPDSVVEIKPTRPAGGTVVWEWRVWDHLIQEFDSTKANYGNVAAHPERIGTAGTGGQLHFFWNHMNSIYYNATLDQIALSVRGNSEAWVIDHSTTTAEAAGHSGGKYGKGGDLLYRWGNPMTYKAGAASDQKLYQQHDVQWIEEGNPGAGNFICFNNGLGRNYSTADEWTPPVEASGLYTRLSGAAFGPKDFTWTYKANPPGAMYADAISSAQRLPNGNTLICDGTHGTFLEVTSAGETVWKYVNPVVLTGPLTQGAAIPADPARAGEFMNGVFRVRRYATSYAGFSGRSLIAGNNIELPAQGATTTLPPTSSTSTTQRPTTTTTSSTSTSSSSTTTSSSSTSTTLPPTTAETTLLLNGQRFEVTVSWKSYTDGSSGKGRAVSLTRDSGTFWFFDAANVELVVKVLDGRAINGCFWVLYGALTDVEYTLRVRDSQSGAEKQYYNPPYQQTSYADVRAFPVAGLAQYGMPGGGEYGRLATLQSAGAPEERKAALRTTEAEPATENTSSCSAGDTALCLNQSRFRAEVRWRNYNDGTSGSGHAVALTADSGYFWFFDSTNVELVVKVLDGHSANGRFWVLYGPLSDVEYTLTITDSQTGAVKTYYNPAGLMSGGKDIQAFAWSSDSASEVRLPGGEFQMGDHYGFVDPSHPSDELPIHKVKVNAFHMARMVVTNEQYAQFLNDALAGGQIEVRQNVVYGVGGSDIYGYTRGYASYYSIGYDGKTFSVADFRSRHPVVGVLWCGAAAYCNWLSLRNGLQECYNLKTWACDFTRNGYRLPTEAEWEYAARGGQYSPYYNYPWGNDQDIARANWPGSKDPYEGTDPSTYPWTTPVGFYDGKLHLKSEYNWPGSAASYQTADGANAFGLYDMAGNVWQLIHDWYGNDYYSKSPSDNPKGPDAGFIMPDGKAYRGMRGGNWYNGYTTTGVNDGHSRVSNRNPSYYRGPQDPNHPWYHVGFRTARNSTE